MSGPPESPPQVSVISPPAHTIVGAMKAFQALAHAASLMMGTSALRSWSSD
jgi:hypothetical protein